MKKRVLFSLALTLGLSTGAWGQRAMDVLDRGLVAVKTSSGVFCSWRINAEEWYDVKYNIYRDGTKLNSTPLSVSNYSDPSGNANSKYTVAAVIDGQEQAKSAQATVWGSNYLEITPKHPSSLTCTYEPNDACCVDVDGDGQLEILMKYNNNNEIQASYPRDGINGEYSLFECLKLDGTVLWWVNCGPNMGDFQNNEQNIVGYDWDGDGKGEVVFRAADGTKIHMADGTVYTVGDANVNYRGATGGGANWFMHSGKEYLVYADGLTGKPYQCIDYPLPRLEASENPSGLQSGSAYDNLVNTAWGDGYGHRSSKHFFGAPYLDGRHPSIFIARGIYTRHKMVAYDVNGANHTLVQRWRWDNAEGGPWFGQGYHNYTIADVDEDGRDEIVFGSMVIDDNGHGLSTTGLGHGDSHHVGDFDPFTPGLEFFGCNEDNPNNNFRNATTSKIYYRTTGGNDDGRANCGNFLNDYPGAQALSSRDDALIGCASHKAIVGDRKSTVTVTQNFRIYWDGDLCDETFDYNNGKNTEGAIYKARTGRIALLKGSKTNNDTKGTPCYQGDILGDWREEVMMRDANNHIRIYTTDIPTTWRNYTLWADHQYRNAMVWQMCGYNQTPHISYYLGELEGYTEAPAPLTMTGRTEVANGGTIGTATNGKHVIVCETNDMAVTVSQGAAPKVLTVNAPSWTQGHDNNNNITTTYYTHTLNGGALTGTMRLVKQGQGVLAMAKNTHTYSGDTKVWGGTLKFDGTLQNSRLWMNRHTKLMTNGGNFAKGIRMEYGSELTIGGNDAASTVSTDTLNLGIGSKVNIDLFAGTAADKFTAKVLKIEKKDWTNGPTYLQPILNFTSRAAELANGKYLIGEVQKVEGNLSDLIREGIFDKKITLSNESGKIYATVQNYESGVKTWLGEASGIWDLDSDANFSNASGQAVVFVPGDELTFDDNGVNTDVTLVGKLMPKSVKFANNTKNYTLGGEGSILGATSLEVNGTGTVTINNTNNYTGGTYVNGGKLVASTFANTIGTDLGALGSIDNGIFLRNGAVLSASASATLGQQISVMGANGTIEVPSGVGLVLSKGVAQRASDQAIIKQGAGTLTMAGGNSVSRLIINQGTVVSTESDLPATVEFGDNGVLDEPATMYTYTNSNTNFVVPAGKRGTLYLDNRCNYKGSLSGAGEFTVIATGARGYLQGNWSAFEGTVNVKCEQRGSYGPDWTWDNSTGLGKATLNIPSGVVFNAGSYNVQIGNLSGNGTVNTTGTITLGGKNEEIIFGGTFTGKPGITKVGKGEWKVSKKLSGIRNLYVEGGALVLGASKQTDVIYAAEIEISGDSTVLTGRGTIGGVVAGAGSIVRPGALSGGANYASLCCAVNAAEQASGRVTIREGAILDFYIRKADGATNSQSSIVTDGPMQLNGTVKVRYDHNYNFHDGDAITLWTCGSFMGNPTFDLEPLPGGQEWDTSELTGRTGIIKVKGENSIASVESDEPTDCYVYTISGIYLTKVVCSPSKLAETLRTAGYGAGIYVVKTAAATLKVAL